VKLVVIILNKTEHLEDLLSAFLEIGVSGTTVVDGVGMGRILSHDVPIFAGLRSAFPGTSPVNKVTLTVVPDDMVGGVLAAAEDVCGSLEGPGTGFLFVLPVETALGLRPPI
jgi:nitrogen regulatory protein P-II 1